MFIQNDRSPMYTNPMADNKYYPRDQLQSLLSSLYQYVVFHNRAKITCKVNKRN